MNMYLPSTRYRAKEYLASLKTVIEGVSRHGGKEL